MFAHLVSQRLKKYKKLPYYWGMKASVTVAMKTNLLVRFNGFFCSALWLGLPELTLSGLIREWLTLLSRHWFFSGFLPLPCISFTIIFSKCISGGINFNIFTYIFLISYLNSNLVAYPHSAFSPPLSSYSSLSFVPETNALSKYVPSSESLYDECYGRGFPWQRWERSPSVLGIARLPSKTWERWHLRFSLLEKERSFHRHMLHQGVLICECYKHRTHWDLHMQPPSQCMYISWAGVVCFALSVY